VRGLASHLARGQGVASLDLLLLGFGAVDVLPAPWNGVAPVG
jgi:hypothetical protein